MKKLFRDLRKDLPEWVRDTLASRVGRFALRGWIVAVTTMFAVDVWPGPFQGWRTLLHGCAVGAGIGFGWYAGRAAHKNQHERQMAEMRATVEKVNAIVQQAGAVSIQSERMIFPVPPNNSNN